MKVAKSEIPLELDCWIDDLSPIQLSQFIKAEKEHLKIKDKLKNLMSSNEGTQIFNGDLFSAFTFKGDVLQEYNDYVLPKRPSLKPEATSGNTRKSKRSAASSLVYLESSDSEDDDDDIPLAKRMAIPPSKLKSKSINIKEEKEDKKKAGKGSKRDVRADSPVPSLSEKTKPKKDKEDKSPAAVFRPNEISSVGGLVIGADGKDSKNDGKEIKLQGKTFPSLVVLAKPWLKVKDMSSTRSKLDSKVKLVLMLTPNKFTEWLIQEGLLKSEQKCTIHKASDHKLGVYSEVSKFPYSGGYVWISDCCPTRFVSVFHGSLFEAAPHPPSCILKLIYHWACQTNIQNVVQWVKVDNVYIKGVYTWLRAICTLAIQQKCKLLGGAGKYIEVGVISLGTTSQDGQQRQVKVEVLGVFDYTERTIRLKAIEPVSDADRNYKKRFQTILEPLNRWVHKDSIIAIDLTVDKMTLYQLGFKNIVQAAANDTTAKHTNTAVMDYLRRIVPRMFQNTLSLLSRQMIQQFLDELVWREHFGTYALQAFNNITSHIAEQTRLNTTETLTQRLYQVATNPFKDWSVVPASEISTTTTPKRLKKPINDADYIPKIKQEKKDSTKVTIKKEKEDPKPSTSKSSKKSNEEKEEKEKHKTAKKDVKYKDDEDMKGLEDTYYGIKDADLDVQYESLPENYEIECPVCSETYDSNEKLQTHLVSHIIIDGKDHHFQCLFCLEKHATEVSLNKHNLLMHPSETKTSSSASYHCIICQGRFNNLHFLTTHLQKNHCQLEMPYACSACNYRSSSHRDVVRHFYDDHKKQNFLQCPFCLSIFKFLIKGCLRTDNINQYYLHLRQHLPKAENKKCPKCALVFVKKGSQRVHTLNDHHSHIKWQSSVRQLLKSTMLIEIPKGPYTKKEALPYIVQQKYDKMNIRMSYGNYCMECDEEIANSEHFIGQLKCSRCFYVTSCQRAMFDHAGICGTSSDPSNNFVETNLESEMHCICGFSSMNGNCLAKHLLTCHHSSVYPTYERAQENIVKKSMLDMLGLVRRDGEVTPEPAIDNAQVPKEEHDLPSATSLTKDQQSEEHQTESILQNEDTCKTYEPSNQIVNLHPQQIMGTHHDVIQQNMSMDHTLSQPSVMQSYVHPEQNFDADMPLLGDIITEAASVLDDDTISHAEAASMYHSQHH